MTGYTEADYENSVIELFRAGNVSRENADILLTKKNIRTRLDRTRPSATVMTIADDYISPFEPRTFTVRELLPFGFSNEDVK